MKNKKSLAHNNIKKKKILLGTLIPVSCLVIATAIVVPVVLTQCMNSYYTLNSVYPNATGTNYANWKYEKGNVIKIKRDEVISVAPAYYYLNPNGSDPTSGLTRSDTILPSTSATPYVLQHVGAKIILKSAGNSATYTEYVWDGSNIKHALKKYSSANPDYSYTSETNYALTSDSAWKSGTTIRIREKSIRDTRPVYYYLRDHHVGVNNVYSLITYTDPHSDDPTDTYTLVREGTRFEFIYSSAEPTVDVWETIK